MWDECVSMQTGKWIRKGEAEMGKRSTLADRATWGGNPKGLGG